MLAEHCTRKNHHEGDQLQYIALVMFLGRKHDNCRREPLQVQIPHTYQEMMHLKSILQLNSIIAGRRRGPHDPNYYALFLSSKVLFVYFLLHFLGG